ncbi:MAG: cytochrome c-type biogenesis protein CcmH [Methylohalobius sp.]|nr:cytochrome c-type biogenesis protein CcmH [Methylohalobius sp.]
MRWLPILALVLTGLALAGVEVRQFPDPKLETRYHHLIEELRCLVCQNQSLADSNADLAEDLRSEVYTMLLAGKSDQEIVDFLVSRYGDFVLYRPPLKTTTALLWLGPFIAMALGALTLWRLIRRRSPNPPRPDINDS